APKMGMTHQDSERYLKELVAYMTKALKLGDEIVFRGFGRFTPQRRAGVIASQRPQFKKLCKKQRTPVEGVVSRRRRVNASHARTHRTQA
ncbi:HU family DNA-binding protein, partial [Candidatus Woesearchaeota archaeon]|nr:HU family DNA-binding protein [Candidatus Woesearchaeota archaeon]